MKPIPFSISATYHGPHNIAAFKDSLAGILHRAKLLGITITVSIKPHYFDIEPDDSLSELVARADEITLF